MSGQVLFCTVGTDAVQLDVVADRGAVAPGTPFVVAAEMPGGFLGAVVDAAVARWTEQGLLITARVTRHNGLSRVDLMCGSTRIVLDVRAVALPSTQAA